MNFFFILVLFHSLSTLKSESRTLLVQVVPRPHGWNEVPTGANLKGGMPPKPKGLTEEEIEAQAVVTPKGKSKEQEEADTPKEKRGRESPSTSPFKSPIPKKKLVLDDTVAESAEVRFSTFITSSLTIFAFSHTHTLTDIC